MSSIDFSHVKFISAGAGSGKTYRLAEELELALTGGDVGPAGVIGTTFTVKAAGELKEGVRKRLIENGRPQLAEQMSQSLIGTVHSVCERLLKRFAFELGLSPRLKVMSLADGDRSFKQALDETLSFARVREINELATRLGQDDWQKAVKDIADQARQNDVDAAGLAFMATESANALLAYFPETAKDDLGTHLKTVVDQAIAAIDLTFDTTKKTREYLRDLRDAAHQLRRNDCPWKVWIDLSVKDAAKKSEPIAATVRDAAASYPSHSALQRDIRDYIDAVMQSAGIALDHFRTLKVERGLIDFLDMEQHMLHALDEPVVQERLRGELELLMVDEFQDTNPMQLALFVKLAQLADKVIFVGDVKQAIYEFRGCDPTLVFNTLEGLAAANAETDVLPSSWRSRPALVHYVNEVFASAFDGEIPRDQVTLLPERSELTAEPAIASWRLAGGRIENRAISLAQAVSELVASGHQIVDRDTGLPRPVRWGDIAVLARTNKRVELVARTLKDQRVPMKMTLEGLLEVPEVRLARACLRRLNDVTDTLASAEIISLADCAEPEAWLADRLRWNASDNDNHRWAENDHPIIARLAELRAGSALRSPVEITARVLNDVGTRSLVTRWGPDATKAAQRQRNLDAFLNLAVEYETHCETQYEAATLTGFLFWLEKPSSPELDLQPVVTTGDAVHVLTYHRAKGLEWPVVIATDFDYENRSSLWDVRVLLTGDFDVTRPLDDRTLRFWPNIFGDRTNNLPLLNHINNGAEATECARKSDAEQRRLAYVGITRARDLLAIALPDKNPQASAWLHTFASDFAIPSGEQLELPNGETLSTSAHLWDGSGVNAETQSFNPRWFIQRPRTNDFSNERVNPSSAAPIENAAIGEVIEFGKRIALKGEDMAAIGSALHAIIAAEIVNPDQSDAVERALAILAAYGVDTYIEAQDAVTAAKKFRLAVQERFGPHATRAEFPVTQVLDDGRIVRGWIDLLVETTAGYHLIDHKSSPRPSSERPDEVKEYSGQLDAYAQALEATGGAAAGTWIHFAVVGEMDEITAG